MGSQTSLANWIPALCSFAALAHSTSATVTLPERPLGADCQFERLAQRPRLFRCRGFADPDWRAALIAESEAAQNKEKTCRFKQCRSFVAEQNLTPAFHALMEALYQLFPEATAQKARKSYDTQPLNVLLYHVGGQTIRWHTDPQGQTPVDLVASAILYLETPSDGGETSFKESEPWPVPVPPTAGDLAVFMSCNETGGDDPKSVHKGMKVNAGQKLVLEKFFALPRSICADGFAFSAPAEVTPVGPVREKQEM